ncbi:MAG TPA: hypothetical protein VLF62_01235 [Candidatus Saccharimonadales bacterium]|nr:hypothetical protein [Candidatus Saccharimonadales bacterium]
MSASTVTPQELARFTAYTEPGTQVIGNDAAGNKISYPVDKIIALAGNDGEATRHAGRTDIEGANRRELHLPARIGGAVMDVLEERGILTCHGFAHRLTKGLAHDNLPSAPVSPGHQTNTLGVGEMGVIGDPASPEVRNPNGHIILNPAEPLHSVVGLGHDSKEVIDMAEMLAPPSITPIDSLVTSYQQLSGQNVNLHRAAPPPDIPPPVNPYNPFS